MRLLALAMMVISGCAFIDADQDSADNGRHDSEVLYCVGACIHATHDRENNKQQRRTIKANRGKDE